MTKLTLNNYTDYNKVCAHTFSHIVLFFIGTCSHKLSLILNTNVIFILQHSYSFMLLHHTSYCHLGSPPPNPIWSISHESITSRHDWLAQHRNGFLKLATRLRWIHHFFLLWSLKSQKLFSVNIRHQYLTSHILISEIGYWIRFTK